jgi:hypothetical protein
MPNNDFQWVMFLYFALGALGGVAFLVVLVRDLITLIRSERRGSRKF